MPDVLIVPTGTANLASVKAAFKRLGAGTVMAERGREIEKASHVILPGVGSFGSSMARLRGNGFVEALRDRIQANLPTICICVGHQLLFERSEESPNVAGVGVVNADVARFTGNVRVPQFGWNEVRPAPESVMIESGYAYFANSYRATEAPGWTVATATHGGHFVAAMERGRVIGCQFHPELSGAYGEALLSRFLELK